jgi:serine/threonine protein kinase
LLGDIVVEFIADILANLGTALATHATVSVGGWLVGFVRGRMRDAPAERILQTLRDLGCRDEKTVRILVRQWRPPVPVSADTRAELVDLLTNLTRNCRFHTTHGTLNSGYLRNERLIEQLLANLQPKRKRDEPVGRGHADWKLEQFLGMGSFGEVWLGRARLYPEPRAFKFITVADAGEWLEREGKTLRQVQEDLADCPNVIKYHNIASDGEPFPFLELEYVPGGSLEDFILTPLAERPPLQTAEAMNGIARGLSAAHRCKIYHRDLKPANILLTVGNDPLAKIADFGLGRVETERSNGVSSYASQGALVGTSLYLPPEAADPYFARKPAQDDVFAFGVIWYQMLTGRIERPSYDFAELLRRKGADSRTVKLLSRCLAHPDRRFPDGVELLDALERNDPGEWIVPEGCFDVGPLAREYLESLSS